MAASLTAHFVPALSGCTAPKQAKAPAAVAAPRAAAKVCADPRRSVTPAPGRRARMC